MSGTGNQMSHGGGAGEGCGGRFCGVLSALRTFASTEGYREPPAGFQQRNGGHSPTYVFLGRVGNRAEKGQRVKSSH